MKETRRFLVSLVTDALASRAALRLFQDQLGSVALSLA